MAKRPTRSKEARLGDVPGLKVLLANIRDGLDRKEISIRAAGKYLEIDHGSLSRALDGQHSLAFDHLAKLVAWSRLSPPLGWPMLPWDTAEKLGDKRQGNDVGTGQKVGHHRPGK